MTPPKLFKTGAERNAASLIVAGQPKTIIVKQDENDDGEITKRQYEQSEESKDFVRQFERAKETARKRDEEDIIIGQPDGQSERSKIFVSQFEQFRNVTTERYREGLVTGQVSEQSGVSRTFVEQLRQSREVDPYSEIDNAR